MKAFLKKHEKMITGTISTFDRIIFKGYLPISYPESAENYFRYHGMLLKEFKDFTSRHTESLRSRAMAIAEESGRPYEYVRARIRKEEYVHEIAKRDGITEGLICVLAFNEENHSFGLRYGKDRPHLKRCSPHCLTFYFYYLDKHFGFMHIRLSTWMPFNIQVYINGHEWLARQLSKKSMDYKKLENGFTHIADTASAQKIANRFPRLRWEKKLHRFAKRVNPLLKTILKDMEYYWVIDQAEYATDVMFKEATALEELYLKWQRHAAVCIQAEDIMKFMGRKLHGSFCGNIQTDAKQRVDITRVKHKVKNNWIKMYNKHGIVLRIETVINRPQEFRIFRLSTGKKTGRWHPLPKRVTGMKRYAEIGLRANSAYIEALTEVDDPTPVYRKLDKLCEPKKLGKQRVRPLNPLRKNDRELFDAIVRGEHLLRGFKSCEVAKQLGIKLSKDTLIRRRQSAMLNRKLRLLRGHRLIACIPRTRRYKITKNGMALMNAAIDLRSYALPLMLKAA